MLWAQVPHVLIRRTKQRFHALPADVGVSMLVAANGLVWLSPADDAPADAVPAPDAMRRVARVRNSILLLAQAFIQVRPPGLRTWPGAGDPRLGRAPGLTRASASI